MAETPETSTHSEVEIVEDLNNNTQHKEDKTATITTPTIKPDPIVIPAKRIDELTDKDREILISNARNGIDNPFYNVKLYKNGSTRICKKKKQPLSNQVVTSNGERVVQNQSGQQKVYLTNDQLIWEHIFELESKYNNLYRKHKKLKSKYNDLYIEDDFPTPQPQQPESQPEQEQEQPQESQQEQEQAQQAQPQIIQPPQQTLYRPMQMGWRASLMQRKNIVI